MKEAFVMTDRPILFSAPMVQALLDGRKTQTRRILPHPEYYGCPTGDCPHDRQEQCNQAMIEVTAADLRFRVGDRLWVKETWTHTGTGVWQVGDVRHACDGKVVYRATDDIPGAGWFPSIFMFRKFSRLTLIVTDVRVERLQDCSEADAIAEGCSLSIPTQEDIDWAAAGDEETGQPYELGPVYTVPGTDCGFGPKPRCELWGPTAKTCYQFLWNSINGPGAWEANPWVVAVSFDVHRCNIDQMPTPTPSKELSCE